MAPLRRDVEYRTWYRMKLCDILHLWAVYIFYHFYFHKLLNTVVITKLKNDVLFRCGNMYSVQRNKFQLPLFGK